MNAALLLSPRVFAWAALAAVIVGGAVYIKVLRGDLREARANVAAAEERSAQARAAYNAVAAANEGLATAASASNRAVADVRRRADECLARVAEIAAASAGWQRAAVAAAERADDAIAAAERASEGLRSARKRIVNTPPPAAAEGDGEQCEAARRLIVEGVNAR